VRVALAEALADEGVDGLTQDKTRPPGRKPLPTELKAMVQANAGETLGTAWFVIKEA
jgi:hypothetical protein